MAAVGDDSPDDYRGRQAFAEYLTDHLISRFTGDAVQRVEGDKPSRGLYFIATLMPRTDLRRRRPKRASPTEVGLEVLIPPSTKPDASLKITVTGAFYYRVFPMLEEQLRRTPVAAISEDESEEGEEEDRRDARGPPSESMLKRIWKKVGPLKFDFEIPLADLPLSGEVVLPGGQQLARQALDTW